MKGLLDTSVFIVDEQGRQLEIGRLPDEVASEHIRAGRLQALRAVQSTYVALVEDFSIEVVRV